MAGRAMRREIKSEINVLPFLDVLLVLVLIFIATSSIITQSIEVNVPSATHSHAVGMNDNLVVIVEVSGVGKYSLVINQDRIEQLSSEKMISEARSRIIANPNTVFLIGGNKDVPYNEIIKVLNLLHQADVKSVGLMTKPV